MPAFPEQLNNSKAQGTLELVWQDGGRQVLSHAFLRAHCKCTQCQSLRLIGGVEALEAAAGVRVEDLKTVGAYGVQLIFSDGHERGIYPWEYLRTLQVTPV